MRRLWTKKQIHDIAGIKFTGKDTNRRMWTEEELLKIVDKDTTGASKIKRVWDKKALVLLFGDNGGDENVIIHTTGFGNANSELDNEYTLTYTDSNNIRTFESDLDDIYPYSELGREEVMDGNTMVWLPEFYFEPILDGNGYLREMKISKEPISENSILSKGRWVGKYMSVNQSSVAKSISGSESTGNISVNDFRTYSMANGSGYSMLNNHAWQSIQILMWVYFKSTNSDNFFPDISDSSYRANGIMNGHKTAVNLSNGRNVFFGFENILKERYHWLDGVITNNRQLYVSDNYLDFNSLSVSNYDFVASMPTSNGNIEEMGVVGGIIVPKKIGGGSYTQYYADRYFGNTNNNMTIYRGSYRYAYARYGLAYWPANNTFSDADATYGSRLMKEI